MSKDSDLDYYEQYIDDNPDACEVMVMVHELAKHIEDKFKYSRKTVCEGVFIAALDMAIGRSDDLYFQNPDMTRSFYEWALDFLNKKKEEYPTKEQQSMYEELYGNSGTTCAQVSLYMNNPDKKVN